MSERTSSARQSFSLTTSVDLADRKVAYFSMEIALRKDLPTYSGGLGMLAGDTLRSAADTGAPMVAISLVHRRGYFRQHLDCLRPADRVRRASGRRRQSCPQRAARRHHRRCRVATIAFAPGGSTSSASPATSSRSSCWTPTSKATTPTTARLTDHLYGGDTYYRLCQETVLGLGGIASVARPRLSA